MNVSREFLYRSASNVGVIDESDYEFAECICESLVSLGSTNLQCIATDGGVLALYLQQVLTRYMIDLLSNLYDEAEVVYDVHGKPGK